jgi:hypothetical protein
VVREFREGLVQTFPNICPAQGVKHEFRIFWLPGSRANHSFIPASGSADDPQQRHAFAVTGHVQPVHTRRGFLAALRHAQRILRSSPPTHSRCCSPHRFSRSNSIIRCAQTKMHDHSPGPCVFAMPVRMEAKRSDTRLDYVHPALRRRSSSTTCRASTRIIYSINRRRMPAYGTLYTHFCSY